MKNLILFILLAFYSFNVNAQYVEFDDVSRRGLVSASSARLLQKDLTFFCRAFDRDLPRRTDSLRRQGTIPREQTDSEIQNSSRARSGQECVDRATSQLSNICKHETSENARPCVLRTIRDPNGHANSYVMREWWCSVESDNCANSASSCGEDRRLNIGNTRSSGITFQNPVCRKPAKQAPAPSRQAPAPRPSAQ